MGHGEHQAWGHMGQKRTVGHRDVWGHGVAEGHTGQVDEWGTGTVPMQVKVALQGTAPHETPIAIEELEGTCRTFYGYSSTSGAGTAQLAPAALALALLRFLLP